MDDRPPRSPDKLLRQFRDWLDESELPGRTMSYLKTGFLPALLEEQDSTDDIDAMREAWAGWEAGTTDPSTVLGVLRDRGLEALLEAIAGDASG